MRFLPFVCLAALLTACATPPDPLLDDLEAVTPSTVLDAPSPATADPQVAELAARGEYLVELLGCGVCHTDGALIGEPNPDRRLAGSRVGIAVSNPLDNENPEVVFAPNLTPDTTTGAGLMTDEALASAIRAGVGRHGIRLTPVMPFAAYARLSDDDVDAIVTYLRSVPAVVHQVPDNVSVGRKTRQTYVHFGVYRSRR